MSSCLYNGIDDVDDLLERQGVVPDRLGPPLLLCHVSFRVRALYRRTCSFRNLAHRISKSAALTAVEDHGSCSPHPSNRR